MWERYRSLTPKQSAWVKAISERLELADPTYRNDWSEGRVPRGEQMATPVPDVLRKPLVLKPPGRK